MNLQLLKLRRLALRMSISQASIKSQVDIQDLLDLENGKETLTQSELKRVLLVYDITEEELKEGFNF